LTAAQPRARDTLSRALAQSVSGKAPAATCRHSIALPDAEGAGFVASILPLEWESARNPLASLPGAAALIIQNPADAATAPVEALAELYGLTGAESRVLEHISRGQAPQDAADELGVSLTTVKTHLQKIFAKTDTTRQAELIQLVARATPPVRVR